MTVMVSQWTYKDPWYNTTISKKLNGQIFEDYLKTGLKDRYEFMCAVDSYSKEHVEITDGAISGGGIPMAITSCKE